jgi:hypothetical protein
VIDDAAKQLGVQPAALSDALKKAYENQIDAAVAAGRITKAQGDAMKQQIESQDYPMLGPGFDHHGPAARAGTASRTSTPAAAYLGLSRPSSRRSSRAARRSPTSRRRRARPSTGS